MQLTFNESFVRAMIYYLLEFNTQIEISPINEEITDHVFIYQCFLLAGVHY